MRVSLAVLLKLAWHNMFQRHALASMMLSARILAVWVTHVPWSQSFRLFAQQSFLANLGLACLVRFGLACSGDSRQVGQRARNANTAHHLAADLDFCRPGCRNTIKAVSEKTWVSFHVSVEKGQSSLSRLSSCPCVAKRRAEVRGHGNVSCGVCQLSCFFGILYS